MLCKQEPICVVLTEASLHRVKVKGIAVTFAGILAIELFAAFM
jgi:hypothetical protein